MLSQWFDPEPTFKGLAFARELTRRGHDVEVLTGFPNYPGGRLYPGYRVRLLQRQNFEGIGVLRVPLYPSHDSSGLLRAANYASFAASAAALGSVLSKPADVMYVYHPPATIGLPAWVLGPLRGVPFVYDIQDLWPDTLRATGMLNNPTALRLVDRWCRWLYRKASRVVVLSPGFREQLIDRGVPRDKVEVIYNWCDEGHLQSGPRDEALARDLGLAGRFNIIFAGTMGRAQALDAVLDAARIVGPRQPVVQFVFVGGGIDADRLRSKAASLSNVRFIARQPIEEIAKILRLADVLLVHLRDDPLFSITIPSKTQAYLAVGRPILMAVRGDAAALVARAGAGFSCLPEDSRSIADAVIRLGALPATDLQMLGEQGRAFYEHELSLRVGVKRFERVFERAIEDSRR